MKYAGLNKNDFINGEGVSVSLWVQGCPHHCKGCFNPETWDFNGGYDVPDDIHTQIFNAIRANGITRNFSILGGEPLAAQNMYFVYQVLLKVRSAYPSITIYMWTGYTKEEVKELALENDIIIDILEMCDWLIPGPYIEEQKNITLELRGSENQEIIDLARANPEDN